MTASTDSKHKPVMLQEVLDGLALKPDAWVIDCTFGRGGHSRSILDKLGVDGRLLALDKDPSAIHSPEAVQLLQDPRFHLRHGSFAHLAQYAEELGWLGRVSAILMDLGVSSPQLDEADRGFSFMREGPLDMRMDTSSGQTAAAWLATVTESELVRVLRDYGEERFARRIAAAVVKQRGEQPLSTTRDLVKLIERAVPHRELHKHPATRTFQAIRIALNGELDDLVAAQPQVLSVLAPEGRWVVIAFHSLEDRLVKRFMRDQEVGESVNSRLPFQPPGTHFTLRRVGKARLPGETEIQDNPRARSAVLRVAERTASQNT